MFRTLPTLRFTPWLDGLKDKRAAAKVFARIVRVEAGNFGDAKSVGDRVSELRIPYGPGYRVYFTIKDGDLVILLVGGDKGSQDRDIKLAKEMAAEIHAEP
ncbi:type II toxin-antitoxin system RelE/ParE family toxin [Sphingomonas lacusdianchii]|uniref:type II toxin-antitoxin system RelE/ParE family toxin n=1 Tax=Sphingomonas lacusdianchii TaxID=2917992 RepID=UPI001F58C7EB|nr:type II toxin-antitoxin system RelE/ParE family toxin [Sphingomonas sp. JXJ CY 53]